MARPKQKGLDYFPLDVSIDQDDKIALIEADYGMEGFSIIIKLLMKIYDEGYFYHWGEKELKLFARRVNLDHEIIQQVVQASLRWDMFDQNLFDSYGILSSRGIQRRYFMATSRRKDVPIAEEYLLLDALEVEKHKHLQIFSIYPVQKDVKKIARTTTGNDVDIQPAPETGMSTLTKQSKAKESKEKESKASAEKRIETIKDTDDATEIFKIYANYFKPPSKYIQDSLLKWQGVFEAPIIQNALEKAVQNGKTFAYANSILKSYQKHNIQTLLDIGKYEEDFKKKFAPRVKNAPRQKEILPYWLNNEYDK